MDGMEQDAARGWHWMEDLEMDLAFPTAGDLAYDRQAVLMPGERDRLSGNPRPSLHPGDWLDNPAGVPPTFVPLFDDVLNRGSPRPGTWIYLTETRVSAGPCLPVMRMVYWDQESETWRRFMATPDCFAPITVAQPWMGADPQQGQPPLGTETRGSRPTVDPGRLMRGPEFVRTERRTLPPREARLMRISVQAFTALMLLENEAGGHPTAPTPEDVAFAAATAVRTGIIELSDSSSSEENVAEYIANHRRARGGTAYRPVRRSTPSTVARGAAAYPGPPVRRLPHG